MTQINSLPETQPYILVREQYRREQARWKVVKLVTIASAAWCAIVAAMYWGVLG